jgi:hypothetical protein
MNLLARIFGNLANNEQIIGGFGGEEKLKRLAKILVFFYVFKKLLSLFPLFVVI